MRKYPVATSGERNLDLQVQQQQSRAEQVKVEMVDVKTEENTAKHTPTCLNKTVKDLVAVW